MHLVQDSNSQSLDCRPVCGSQMVTVVITGCCQPDEVNLRLHLIHIRQTEVLFYADNYYLLCAPGQGQQYRLWKSVTYKRAKTFLAFSYHCCCIDSKQAWCSQRFSSGFRSPSIWMAAIFPRTYGIAICISAISINSGVAASWSQKSDFKFAVCWQSVLSYLEVTSHHPAVLGVQSHFCCRRYGTFRYNSPL